MMRAEPVTLEFNGVRLEPLGRHHEDGLRAAAQDGELWKLRVTSVPEPHETAHYIRKALETPDRLAFAVVDAPSGAVVGTTGYRDIVPDIGRLEIGYTWYAQSRQRSHVNTSCKLLLLSHAFDTLGAGAVVLRTDCANFASQAAIERLGAKKDGVLRHEFRRRDGSIRDTVMYSILRDEWAPLKSRLHGRLAHHAGR